MEKTLKERIADLDRKIFALEDEIGMYESDLMKSITQEEKNQLFSLITVSRTSLNHMYVEKISHQLPVQSSSSVSNRLSKIIASLQKCNIETSGPIVKKVLFQLARNDRDLDIASTNTELALSTYIDLRDSASTETKSCIASEINMKVNLNGSVFPDFPSILSAHDSSEVAKLVKILRVSDETTSFSSQQQDVKYEAESAKFVHEAIVPMERKTITIDDKLAAKFNCRVGVHEVLIMPWYTSTLNQHPSNCLNWIAVEGRRIMNALQYLHQYSHTGYVHMDIKAINIFVDHANHWFLGDFGSCKPVGEKITSCSIQYCWEDVRGQIAQPKYDYFMFLIMLLTECLEDRRTARAVFYDEMDSKFVNASKVVEAAQSRIYLKSTPRLLVGLLTDVMRKCLEFGL